jgi:F-type H+-transporting ATPase subunit b
MDIAANWILPSSIGPLRIDSYQLLVGLVCFGLTLLLLARVLLPRINRVLEQRDEAIEGRFEKAEALQTEAAEARERNAAILAEGRHDAAHTRQQALEEGAALIAEARAEAVRERDGLIAAAHTEIAAEREVAEAVLHPYAEELAQKIATRVLGEPAGVPAEHRD